MPEKTRFIWIMNLYVCVSFHRTESWDQRRSMVRWLRCRYSVFTSQPKWNNNRRVFCVLSVRAPWGVCGVWQEQKRLHQSQRPGGVYEDHGIHANRDGAHRTEPADLWVEQQPESVEDATLEKKENRITWNRTEMICFLFIIHFLPKRVCFQTEQRNEETKE